MPPDRIAMGKAGMEGFVDLIFWIYGPCPEMRWSLQ
jgi:hypothetical protein